MSTPTLLRPTRPGSTLRRTDWVRTNPTMSPPPGSSIPDAPETTYRQRGPHVAPQEFTHTVTEHPVDRRGTGTGSAPALADPTALCCAVAHAATEALRGIRPLNQLARSVSPEVFDQLHARAQVRAAARNRRGAPPTPQSRSRVRRARTIRISPTVAEASVVIDDVDRVRAAALRVEEHRGRWRVVVLELG